MTNEEIIAYIADCTLATVCDMACKRSRGAYEYKRQQIIAQKIVDHIRQYNIPSDHTRVYEVSNKFDWSVQKWADSLDVKKPQPAYL